MDRNEKKLMRHFEEKAEYQKSKKRKAAARIRSSMKKKGKREKFDGKRWEDEHEVTPSHEKRRRGPSLDDLASLVDVDGESAETRDDLRTGLVISISRRICTVLEGETERECFLPARIAAVQQSEIAVGDKVLFFAKDDGSLMVHSVVPRETFLARPDPHMAHKQRVIAANVDFVVNVVSVKSPPLKPRLIDRYLIAITMGGAKPVICVNKVDLLSPERLAEELAELDVYRELGLEIVHCSAETGEGLDAMHATIEGGTSVFVGHSGVGKSSILKSLVAHLDVDHIDADAIRTAGVSESRGTGRHTTRMATLFDLGNGTTIIDTPGIREFGLWSMDAETLSGYFPEFEEVSDGCHFNDCSHTHEPSCAVKTAVEEGELSGARYDTYLRLIEEMKESGQG